MGNQKGAGSRPNLFCPTILSLCDLEQVTGHLCAASLIEGLVLASSRAAPCGPPHPPQELLGGTLCKHGPSSWRGCLGCRPLLTGLSPALDSWALPLHPLHLAQPGTRGHGGVMFVNGRSPGHSSGPSVPAEQPSSAQASPKPQVAWESSLLPKEPSRLRQGGPPGQGRPRGHHPDDGPGHPDSETSLRIIIPSAGPAAASGHDPDPTRGGSGDYKERPTEGLGMEGSCSRPQERRGPRQPTAPTRQGLPTCPQWEASLALGGPRLRGVQHVQGLEEEEEEGDAQAACWQP